MILWNTHWRALSEEAWSRLTMQATFIWDACDIISVTIHKGRHWEEQTLDVFMWEETCALLQQSTAPGRSESLVLTVGTEYLHQTHLKHPLKLNWPPKSYEPFCLVVQWPLFSFTFKPARIQLECKVFCRPYRGFSDFPVHSFSSVK